MEICENYDIDGLELDFMRHQRHFNDDTHLLQRKQIMTSFVADVRSLLDRTSINKKHRYLCIRVPCHTHSLEQMGIDLSAMVHSGVDMVNLSNYYHFQQMNDISEIRKQIPFTDLYFELSFTGGLRTLTSQPNEQQHILATEESLYTAAYLAHLDGINGIRLPTTTLSQNDL